MIHQQKRLPSWLRKNKNLNALRETKKSLRKASLSTVCEEARCPNICECFAKPTATFLILGDICTRHCRFCSVKKGVPSQINSDEPSILAQAAFDLRLDHVVITSVSRDDLPDGGAGQFAETINAVRTKLPRATIEVLTPDFGGNEDHLRTVIDARPDVFNHNVETTARLHSTLRPEASLSRSLEILRKAKTMSDNILIKSGFMVGLGESEAEIIELLSALEHARCDIVTIGQYMQPSKQQVGVVTYWMPVQFDRWADLAKTLGIRYVVSGPLVRSSYHAKEALEETRTHEKEHHP